MMTTLNNRVSALFADPLQAVLREFDHDFEWDEAADWDDKKPTAPLCIWEDHDSVYVEMDIPGLTADELDVAIEKQHLVIRGQRRAPDRTNGLYREERFFGQFERSIRLGDSIDTCSIEASLSNGVLCCKLAKKPESQRQKIVISTKDPAKRIESV